LRLKYIAIKRHIEPQVSFGHGKLLAKITLGTLHFFLCLPWFLKAYLNLLGIETYAFIGHM